MNRRTIRITKTCEFGEPGDLVCPEPWDIASLLVETRGVAEYIEDPTPRAPKVERQTKRRKRTQPTRTDK